MDEIYVELHTIDIRIHQFFHQIQSISWSVWSVTSSCHIIRMIHFKPLLKYTSKRDDIFEENDKNYIYIPPSLILSKYFQHFLREGIVIFRLWSTEQNPLRRWQVMILQITPSSTTRASSVVGMPAWKSSKGDRKE